MEELIIAIFGEWLYGPMQHYKLGDKDYYSKVDREKIWHASLNPYLKTEADIQVKFGGFLELRLAEVEPALTVHSELNVYPKNRRMRADLSVHDVSSEKLWLWNDPDPVTKTVKAIIEIKYSNYREPNWYFENGYIKSDLEKLSELPDEIHPFLLILDEGNAIDSHNIEETINGAQSNNVVILSNNPHLNTTRSNK